MKPTPRIPLYVKIAYTAFMAVLVPVYWYSYGPTNFLYFCDIALFFTLAAVWTEKPIFAAMPAVGILFPQAIWCIDFFASAMGFKLLGMTGYMFDETKFLFLRGLSFFHFWLPFFLVYLIWKLRYDCCAWLGWTIIAWALLTISYLFLPAPPAPADKAWMPVNVNYVYGMSDDAPQTWMPHWAWLVCLYVGMPIIIFLPTHFLLKWLFPKRK